MAEISHPQAFPLPGEKWEDGDKVSRSWDEPGMTLRDYFAAKAMEGWLATYPPDASFPDGESCRALARKSYMLAEAMLHERESR